MENLELKKLITKMNRGGSKLIFTRQIGKNVEQAKVWERRPIKKALKYYDCESKDFYFIKNDDGKYVGAVYDMIGDLHWYLLQEHRGKGYLTNAMRDVILPFIFDYRRLESLKITIDASAISDDNYKASRKVAEASGFVTDDDLNFTVSDIDVDSDHVDEINGMLTSEREQEIQQNILFLFKHIRMITDEVEMIYGKEREIVQLNDIGTNLNSWRFRLEDLVERHK